MSPVVAHFYDYWRELVLANGGPPRRDQIDPTRLAPCLPHCWLYELMPGSDGYKCVLSGEAINAAWGRNIMGLRAADFIATRELIEVEKRWEYLQENCLVAWCNYDGAGRRKSVERLVAPLLNRQGEPTMVFGVAMHRFDPRTEREMELSPVALEYLYFDPRAV